MICLESICYKGQAGGSDSVSVGVTQETEMERTVAITIVVLSFVWAQGMHVFL